jgi:23S rRNA (cytosine1962-C5)-methyltransferase
VNPTCVISDRARKRLKSKHPWIFSNEIVEQPTVAAGNLVTVQDSAGNFIATGYYNPHTLIAVRILSFHSTFSLQDRIRKAAHIRTQYYSEPLYRLIYGESDGLPGLIADRYGDTLVVQILTAGMEKMREQILHALIELIQPARILLRNDSSYRELEGLPLKVEWVHGEPLKQQQMESDGIRFVVDFESGQKTGLFLDQQNNRRRLSFYAHGQTMLDVFAYSGMWSLYGAKAGLRHITAVDSSEHALALIGQNADLNGYSITTVASDAFDFLKSQYNTPDRYDVIVLDPPAFCKSKRQLTQALKGYREINLRAMKLLQKEGVLFTCSCSQPVSAEIFEEVLRQAAADSGRAFILREMLLQPPDHPVLLHFPESHYLKCAVLQLQ